MYLDLYEGLNLKSEDLERYDSPLMGFDGKMVVPRGMIRLPVQVEDGEVQVNFIVVEAYSPYIVILARPCLHAMGAVSSTLHLKVKYPTRERVGELLVGHEARADSESSEDLERVVIEKNEERYFQVGSQLPDLEKAKLVKFLKVNSDVFTWNAYDVPGIDPVFICHQLNMNPGATPRKQPHRRSSKEHVEAVRSEVNKLNQAGAIKEIFYPEIDQLVDATVGHLRMSFLDAFLGYHQIPLSLSDHEKTAFRAPNENYHYQNPKEVQRLTGMATTLHRFISCSADRYRPFFQLLQKWKDFHWSKECVVAFEELKQYLSNLPILSRPEKEEVLCAYLAVTNYAISLVLVRNEDGVQPPVYYVSKSFQEVETRYLPLEKAVLAIVHATRKLPHYFQAHTMVVLTHLPLQALLRQFDYTGRIAKWGTMLGTMMLSTCLEQP
ncbi:uncharacterized protein LOC142616968 [Castanea sativa]|uniref:uncharacterized protein LOC142616968 n=1 Tax=Castanea sativa TaxID=21020 RepID=UPI003F65152C